MKACAQEEDKGRGRGNINRNGLQDKVSVDSIGSSSRST